MGILESIIEFERNNNAEGFGYRDKDAAIAKFREEAQELVSAIDSESKERQEEELGDLLYMIATFCRLYRIDSLAAVNRSHNIARESEGRSNELTRIDLSQQVKQDAAIVKFEVWYEELIYSLQLGSKEKQEEELGGVLHMINVMCRLQELDIQAAADSIMAKLQERIKEMRSLSPVPIGELSDAEQTEILRQIKLSRSSVTW